MKSLKHHRLSPQFMLPWHPGKTISTTRAAELLGCSSGTILSLIQDGSLEAFKRRKRPNSHYLVIYESVLKLADEWRKESGAAPDRPEIPSTQSSQATPVAPRNLSSRS